VYAGIDLLQAVEKSTCENRRQNLEIIDSHMRHPKLTSADSANGERRSTPTLTSKVYEQIRGEIIACDLQPNEKLRLAVLQKRLGVGMSAIREALSRLAAEGLVWAEDQRGFRVSPVSAEDLIDLTQVRIQIEQTALKQSIEQGDVTWEANLLAAYHQLTSSMQGSFNIDPKLHRNFHNALVAACKSRWLHYFREIMNAEYERYRSLAHLASRRKKRDVVAEHKALFDATLRRDVEAACKAVERHFSTTARLALEAQVLPGDSKERPSHKLS